MNTSGLITLIIGVILLLYTFDLLQINSQLIVAVIAVMLIISGLSTLIKSNS